MLMQSDSDSRKEDEDSSGPDDESEAWIDGRVEEQAPTVTDDILIDPDPSRESEVRSFEKELALEEAILQELTPLKREGPDEPLTRAAPKTSVRQLMQDIENARELTRRVEVARRWSAMNERTTPVKVRSPLRPTVHVASVGADWSALMETTNASQSEICRTCGSPVASAVNIPVVEKSSHRGLLYSRSDTSPGANGIDKKPYTPPLPSPSTGAGRDAPYVWPVSRKTPMLSREDPIEEPSSPKLYLPVPTIPLPTGSTLPQSGFYTGSYGRVVSSSVASPPPRRTEDRSTGDCPVTVSTAETQTNPMELTTTREFAEPRLEAAASRTTDYDTPYHEVLRDRLWRSAAHVTGGHDREELVLVDGKIVSYNRESDPPVGHGGRTRQSTTGESRHTALSSTNESVVSGPSVQPKVTTVRGNDHLVYAYRARVTACDWRAAGSFLRAGIGNSEDVLWGEPITTRIKWEVDDVITVVGVARPAPREM
ncbi:hypothetical protein Pmar_PMAR024144 [Perkinsus marinus ATCC 50983]|uniref:Uncharacterized protein n=1 Tax=Perkinsus marinus (strain ATCC 50983 / TXsc) TaxID=423536 RepID=C5L2A8_PERM5|nr:hypothetical protein Pmar_PMAR024144 [Perkinsus marinus ATCC 50983]EER09120.1 hypothetical protein Pmar_PMAR024144 [Perkinsus marinus ATCC 50983]|eukprot:XP_002777304.1 hypothetical protein Pmar_PMAR024144 [Perkinsus marinus ATCC 50983]